jgi:hypothetical protein
MPFAMYNGIGNTVGTCRLLGFAVCLWITTNDPSSSAVPKIDGIWRSCLYFISPHGATLPSLKRLCLETRSKTRDHRLLEDFFNRSSCSLQHFVFNDDCLDQESVVNYLTIPFLETIPDIQAYVGESRHVNAFRRMQQLKDSQDTPTFRRLQISYPTCIPAFTWK